MANREEMQASSLLRSELCSYGLNQGWFFSTTVVFYTTLVSNLKQYEILHLIKRSESLLLTHKNSK